MARFEAFWDVMCDYRQFIWVGVMVCLFFLVLAVIALALAPRGTGSFLLAVVNLVMVLAVGSAIAGMYWVCVKRAKKTY